MDEKKRILAQIQLLEQDLDKYMRDKTRGKKVDHENEIIGEISDLIDKQRGRLLQINAAESKPQPKAIIVENQNDDSSDDGTTLGEWIKTQPKPKVSGVVKPVSGRKNASMERKQDEPHPSNWVWVPQIQRFVHPQHPLYLPEHSAGHQVRLAAEKEDKVTEEKVSTKQHLEIMLERYMADVLKQPNDKLKKEKYDALTAMFRRYPFWYGHDFIQQFNKSFDVHKKALAGTLPKTKFKHGDAELSSLAAQAINVATTRKQEMERNSIHRSHLGDVPHEDPSVDIAADNAASKYAPDEQTRTRASERLIERAIKNEPTPKQLAAISDMATERNIRKGLA
jgi:hypothetical protein